MATKFEYGLTEKELEKRTKKVHLSKIKLLEPKAVEFKTLAKGDKEALKHLVCAANILEDVHYVQDNAHNLEFKAFLEKEVAKGSKQAQLTQKLFLAQRGINALDRNSYMIELAKGVHPTDGKGVYPEDLSKDEFHKILIDMLQKGEVEAVKNMLNQRSMVVRDGKKLKGVDYTEFFKKEFHQAAAELEKAAETSTNADFNEYLRLQATALRKNDPMLDAYADKKWATLQDTPLEFTISREQYADRLTGTVVENEKLAKLLEQNKINPISKDFIGVRVGIVNKEGTETLLKIKKYLPELAANMPYNNEYEQVLSTGDDDMQTMVDVDLVTVTGDEGKYRAGITLAQNLPNNDKMSISIGGGRRNVYHRQIRLGGDPKKLQKRLDTILNSTQHKYYNKEADHWFTISHENTHSLGPKKGTEKLGKYKDIIEENKADMGALAFLDILQNLGMYTKKEKEQILVTFCTNEFLKSEPTLAQAHRVRSVMQVNYFIKHGAIEVSDKGIIKVNINKVVATAQKMLAEIVRVQLDGDFAKAEKYVTENFEWIEEMERVAKNIRKVDKSLNGYVVAKLAEKLIVS